MMTFKGDTELRGIVAELLKSNGIPGHRAGINEHIHDTGYPGLVIPELHVSIHDLHDHNLEAKMAGLMQDIGLEMTHFEPSTRDYYEGLEDNPGQAISEMGGKDGRVYLRVIVHGKAGKNVLQKIRAHMAESQGNGKVPETETNFGLYSIHGSGFLAYNRDKNGALDLVVSAYEREMRHAVEGIRKVTRNFVVRRADNNDLYQLVMKMANVYDGSSPTSRSNAPSGAFM
ncbi:MAG: hypothetical protein QS98_C0010G0039 [archaeon GW2011_AR3]|nr:MAG: hypothetical protein QS98_C0010G0039 [archaeon GW2011_AR3]